MRTEQALERAIADACLGAGTGEALAGDLRAWLERHGVDEQDIEAIVAAPRRLIVYRSLVRNGLSGVLARTLPRTRARLNAACKPASGSPAARFDADVRAFVDEVGPRTHYVRDVPFELVAWATPRWRADPDVPAYLPDLAAHELAQRAVAWAPPAAANPALAPLAMDRALVFSSSTRLMQYAWAVHELPGGEATAEPERRDVSLLAYRDEAHAVRWLELTSLAATVLERLLQGDPLFAGIERACADRGADAAAARAAIARLLADLASRGVLLGARQN